MESSDALVVADVSMKPPTQQQRMSSTTGALPGRIDPDVASLSLSIDQHMQALTSDAVDHLMAVKARLMASLEAAVEQENAEGNTRLQAKQAETDAVTAELQHTQQQLQGTELVLDRVAGGYAGKQRAVYDRLNLLRSWYVWREWAHKERRLQYLGLRLQQWYVRRWLLGRAWDRWVAQARLQYRTLVAEHAEKQQRADAAALHAIHAQEAGALRAQIEGLQAQLQEEAAARNKMEEEMKRSFMRGVTAINLEALQIMRRGAPPSGANPFPVPLPLNAATAAAGLVAAGGQQGEEAVGAAGDVNLDSTLQNWAAPQQQVQAPANSVAACAQGAAAAAAGSAKSWGPVPTQDLSAPIQAQSAYGAAAVVQLQPQAGHAQQRLGSMPGIVTGARSPQQAGRVYVERGPAKAAAASPAHKGGAVGGSSPQASRTVGVRRSLQQGPSAGGRPGTGQAGR